LILGDVSVNEALILAGGFGTRLRSRVPYRPKPLAPIEDRPFLSYQLEWLMAQGVSSVTLAVHYRADDFFEFAEEYKSEEMQIRVVLEKEPLGTGGAVVNAVRMAGIEQNFFVINGDTHYRFSMGPVFRSYEENQASALLVASPVDDAHRFGTVSVENGKLTSFNLPDGRHKPGLVNAGVYIFDPKIMEEAPEGPFSIEGDFFPAIAEKRILHVCVLEEGENFLDIGTPESYDTFCAEKKAAKT